MDDWMRWGLVVLALAAITAFGWWNKDSRAAVPLAIAAAVILTLLTQCASAAEVRFGFGHQVGPATVGRDPAGVVWLMPLEVGPCDVAYLHVSSLPDERDRSTVDSPGIGCSRPLWGGEKGPVARAFVGANLGRARGVLGAVELRQPLIPGVLELAPMVAWRRGERMVLVSALIVFGGAR